MERDELEHLISAAAQVTDEYEFIIIGTQSILGPIPNPPPEMKLSMETDMYSSNAPEKADLIDGALGDVSRFDDTYKA